MNFNDYFYEKDGKLFWKEARNNSARINEEAGFLHHTGYRYVKLFDFQYGVHRVLWRMRFGDIPKGMEVDHINGDRLDNSISNLRLVSSSVNSKNRCKRSDNVSGVAGVGFHKLTGKWWAMVSINKKRKHLGLFDSWFEAVCARKSAQAKDGEYTIRHGK